jgi:hypothetical protein
MHLTCEFETRCRQRASNGMACSRSERGYAEVVGPNAAACLARARCLLSHLGLHEPAQTARP